MVEMFAARLLLALPPWEWLLRLMPDAVVRRAIHIAQIEQAHAVKVSQLLLEVRWLRDEIEEVTRGDQSP